MVEERIALEYVKQEIRCPTHLYIGQEAVGVGVIAHLRKKDPIFSYHRSHGHYLSKGGSLKAMISELYGKVTGCSKGMGGSQHLIDLSVNFCGAIPIVSETIPLAVGCALAEKMQRKKTITTVFFGDAATEEGIFAESVNFAVLKNIPVLFVCENNLYSISTHIRDRQPNVSIATRAKGMGIQTFTGNGNDVLNVYDLSQRAISYIKNKKKPAFIEFETYRSLEHCGPSLDPPGYRPLKEITAWKKKDPLALYTRYILSNNVLSLTTLDTMKREIQKEIDSAFLYAHHSPYPTSHIFLDTVFCG